MSWGVLGRMLPFRNCTSYNCQARPLVSGYLVKSSFSLLTPCCCHLSRAQGGNVLQWTNRSLSRTTGRIAGTLPVRIFAISREVAYRACSTMHKICVIITACRDDDGHSHRMRSKGWRFQFGMKMIRDHASSHAIWRAPSPCSWPLMSPGARLSYPFRRSIRTCVSHLAEILRIPPPQYSHMSTHRHRSTCPVPSLSPLGITTHSFSRNLELQPHGSLDGIHTSVNAIMSGRHARERTERLAWGGAPGYNV